MRPVEKGGWAYIYIYSFNKSLLIKNMWRATTGQSTWSLFMKDKYMFDNCFMSWITYGDKNKTKKSYIWHSMMNVLPCIMGFIEWEIGDGVKIMIRLDAMVGMHGGHSLSAQLLHCIHGKGIHTLNQIYITKIDSIDGHTRRGVIDLDLPDKHIQEWEEYISNIRDAGITLQEQQDKMGWNGKLFKGAPKVKGIYLNLNRNQQEQVTNNWLQVIWKWDIP